MDANKKKKIEKILANLEKANRLTPDAVIEEARDTSSPLHDQFDWNDATAAHEHRRQTARRIIRAVVVPVTTEAQNTILVSVYTHNPANKSEQGYVKVANLKSSKDLAREALAMEVDRLKSIIQRTRGIASELGLADDFERILCEITELQDKVAAA